MTVLPGPIRQIGFVVPDLDAALADWVNLGLGPWFVMRGLPLRGLYRGEPCETVLSVAPAHSGDLQVELICQDDQTPSIFTEFLSSGSAGFHQLTYWATDLDATMAAVRAAGWPVVCEGGGDFGVRFAYVEPPNSPVAVIEIAELTEATAARAALHP